MNLPETVVSRTVEPVISAIGRTVSWIWIVLMVVIVVNVFARYLFGQGRVEFEELQWHLYSIGFMLCLSYALLNDAHIRVDILHERFSERTKAWVDVLGIVVFLLPFLIVMLIYGVPFVADSFEYSERSASPGGLPFRWAIKSVMLIGFGLLLIAAVSRLTRLAAFLHRNAD